MDGNWTPEDRKKTVDLALKRALKDAEFRSLVLRDPRAAVRKIAGKELPSGFNIRVLEKQDYDLTIVLPNPAMSSGELSDAELEQVAGGRAGYCGFSCAISLPEGGLPPLPGL